MISISDTYYHTAVCVLLVLAVALAIVLARTGDQGNAAKLAAFFTVVGDGLALLALGFS